MKKMILAMLVMMPLFSHAGNMVCLKNDVLVIIDSHQKNDELDTTDSVTVSVVKLHTAKDLANSNGVSHYYEVDDQSFSKGTSYVSKNDAATDNFYFKLSTIGEDDGLRFSFAVEKDDKKAAGKSFPNVIKMNLDFEKDCRWSSGL